MTNEEFDSVVKEAIKLLPDPIRTKLEEDGVMVVIQDKPTREQLGKAHHPDELLLGLYEGVPLTERYEQGLLPDKITIFKKSIEQISDNKQQMVEEIRKTIVHEVGHFFGLDDSELESMGL